MKPNLLKKTKLSSQKSKDKQLQNGDKEPLPSDVDAICVGTDATETSNDMLNCVMDCCPKVTQMSPEQGELEALGVLMLSEQHQQHNVNLQPCPPALRTFVPKTEPDHFPLNQTSFQVKTEPGIYEVLQRESTLTVEEKKERYKEVKLEMPEENLLCNSDLEETMGNVFIY